MIKLWIEEEYGYRDWYLECTEEEYEKLLERWRTIRGMSCLVPVKLVFPTAVELDDFREENPEHNRRCHMHGDDDSYLEGSNYKIPPDEFFWMEGRRYEECEYWPDSPPKEV